MHRGHDGFVLMRAGDREHVRVRVANRLGSGAEAARHDHAAVFGECLADRVERLLARAVEKTASVDDDDVGARIVGGGLVALCSQRLERMRSESTSAFGQPRLTKPILGTTGMK